MKGLAFNLIDAVRLVFEPANGLTAHERLVAACLARHADISGASWPSISTVASECGGLADNTVRRALRGLVVRGWLVVASRPGRTAVYTLAPVAVPKGVHVMKGFTSRRGSPGEGQGFISCTSPLRDMKGTPSSGEPEASQEVAQEVTQEAAQHAGANSNSAMQRVERVYCRAVQRNFSSSRDQVSIREALSLTGGDPAPILQAIDTVMVRRAESRVRDRINGFGYFLPAVREAVATGGGSPPVPSHPYAGQNPLAAFDELDAAEGGG